jgi:small subunit ribosomal protein S7
MSRRRQAPKRPVLPDAKFHSTLVAPGQRGDERGKKSTAQRIVYGAFDQIAHKNPPATRWRSCSGRWTTPSRAWRSRPAAWAAPPTRCRWKCLRPAVGPGHALAGDFADAARAADEAGLAAEIMEAYQGQGNAIRKRDEVHKMAQANKAFAHFRW